MGCCESSEEEIPERRALLSRQNSHMAPRSHGSMGPKEIAAGLRVEQERVAAQTPAETGNYEQRVLDHIVQTAIKDFIDISQTTEMQDGDESDVQEKSEIYEEQVKTVAAKISVQAPAVIDGLVGLSGAVIPVIGQRQATPDEEAAVEPAIQMLTGALETMSVEDRGGLLVTFSASLSASRGSPHFGSARS